MGSGSLGAVTPTESILLRHYMNAAVVKHCWNVPDRARRAIPVLSNGLSPPECHRQLHWPQPLHTLLAHSLRLTRVMHTAGKHCWHSWEKLLARLAHACAQCMLPARMTFTPRARFAHPEHNLTHTCLARPFLEHREAREGLVPAVLMFHPNPDVTWMPCTGTLPRNPPKCGPMGTLCSSCECHTRGSWWGEDSSTPASPRAGGPQHPAGSDPALG